MRVAVTGANGLVGGYVCRAFSDAGDNVVALVRDPDKAALLKATEVRKIPSLSTDTPGATLSAALNGVDAVVHLAAHVHVMSGAPDPTVFHDVNVGGSLSLLEAAIAAGAKTFIYMSSVKAAGEETQPGRPLSHNDTPAPEDDYGRSKHAAEEALMRRAKSWDGRLVIFRPTFVYGWPATGNFRTVISAVKRGLPLPFAEIDNRRDMIYAGNLADAVKAAAHNPAVGAGPYFICDGKAVSTTELFTETARAFNGRARLFPMPACLLRLLGTLTGRQAAVARLLGHLEVSSAPFCRDAGWQPPYKMSEGLAETAALASTDDSQGTA